MKQKMSNDVFGSSQRIDLLDSAIASLNPLDQTAILLRYTDGLSLAEVGNAMGVSQDTAAKRIARAVEKLRRYFAKHGALLAGAALIALLSEKLAPANTVSDLSVALAGIHAGIGQVSMSAHAYVISQGVINQMKLIKIKVALAYVCGGVTGFCDPILYYGHS